MTHLVMVDICAKSFENQTKDVEVMLQNQMVSTIYGIRSTAHLKPYTPPSDLLAEVTRQVQQSEKL